MKLHFFLLMRPSFYSKLAVFALSICICLYMVFYLSAVGCVVRITSLAIAPPFIENFGSLLKQKVEANPYDSAALEAEFDARWSRVNKVCHKHYRIPLDAPSLYKRAARTLSDSWAVRTAFYVDEANKLLMCIIPKIASTTLKQIFLYISVNSSYPSLKSVENLVHNRQQWPNHTSFQPLYVDKHNQQEAIAKMSNYTKIMWIRHPTIRLVSAWNNKLTGKNPTYHKAFGQNILREYRNMSATDANQTQPVRLDEFFRYIKDHTNGFRMNDVHWTSYNTQCMPCYVNYDYVVKMEHWYPETHYLVSNLVRKARGSLAVDDGSLEEIGQMLTTQNANGDAKWIQQLQKLPLDLRKAVDTTFAFDFELFGYNPFR